MNRLTVIGGGLAGAEAAWQAASRGIPVRLVEMRPRLSTGAHRTDRLAELVCSNSIGSRLPDRASGILLGELRALGSLLVGCAEACAVPAGGALAVDRDAFAARVTEAILPHPHIAVERTEATTLPEGPAIVASGPLTSPALSAALAVWTGEAQLYFYDAIAPVVSAESVDRAVAFRASRRDPDAPGGGDYLNCPMNRAEYERLVAELSRAERAPLREFEAGVDAGVCAGPDRFFEGCLPVEVLAARDPRALAFGPLRPVGLRDPRTGKRPWAVVQLRQENLAGDRYNLVGFQTNLRAAEQVRVFRLIPGLERAEFVRFGQMHRNTYLNAPRLLHATLAARARDDLFFAGQIAGVEGYLGNIATGWLAGVNAARRMQGQPLLAPPPETLLGALTQALVRADPDRFQPIKASLGLLPPLPESSHARGKRARASEHAARAAAAFRAWWTEL